MSRRTFRGFLSKTERRYLEFLQYTQRNGQEYSNRATWNEIEKMPHRSLDFQIRWKTREALKDLRLVFQKFGLIELKSLIRDKDALNNLLFLIEMVDFIKSTDKNSKIRT
jgi:hypothetical protein